MTRANCRRLLTDLFYDGLSGLLMSVAVQLLAAPNHIVAGGVSGVATLINYLYGLPIATISLLFNLPLMLWGYRERAGFYLKYAAHAGCARFDYGRPVRPDALSLLPGRKYVGRHIWRCVFGDELGHCVLPGRVHRRQRHSHPHHQKALAPFLLGGHYAGTRCPGGGRRHVIYGDIEAAMYAYIMIVCPLWCWMP